MNLLPTELTDLFAADGDRVGLAWSAFVREHSDLILRVARVLGRNHDDMMDQYAYVLEKLQEDDYRRLRTFEPGRCRFTTWLAVVTRRLCHDRDRERHGRLRGTGKARERSREKRAERRRLTELISEAVDLVTIPDPAGRDPELELRERELREAVRRALDQLTAGDRLLIRLRFEDGRSAREIAEFVGLPSPFHVYRRIDAILKHMRVSLSRSGVDDRFL